MFLVNMLLIVSWLFVKVCINILGLIFFMGIVFVIFFLKMIVCFGVKLSNFLRVSDECCFVFSFKNLFKLIKFKIIILVLK